MVSCFFPNNVSRLGDRHGANILLDSTTGGIVHIDFQCLFWEGEILPTAERVPYRLTLNVVDGMGLTGYEGAFRKCAEITLGILRTNS